MKLYTVYIKYSGFQGGEAELMVRARNDEGAIAAAKKLCNSEVLRWGSFFL
jgi:hypothetical protein